MEKRLGRGEEKGRSPLLYFELQFQRNGIFDWSPTCQSVNNKNLSVPKESNFHGSFCGTWRTDSFCKLHSTFEMEAQVFKEGNCFCGTWTSAVSWKPLQTNKESTLNRDEGPDGLCRQFKVLLLGSDNFSVTQPVTSQRWLSSSESDEIFASFIRSFFFLLWVLEFSGQF